MAIRYIVEINDPVTHRFSTAVRDETDPTDATYPDGLGGSILCPVRLSVPKVNNKISDSISGATVLTQYTLTIENSDGKYDDVKSLGWFNIPVVLKRSDISNPSLDDFNTIMTGEISYPVVTQDSVSLVVDNLFRSLTQEVTNTFNDTDYPNIGDNEKDSNIPIGFGELLNVPLFPISTVDVTQWIALDKDYITAVSDVYDSDGNSITFFFDAITGQITATDAVSADVTGQINNKIGTIITGELELKADIVYDSTNWDTTETNSFVTNDSKVNFYFAGGTVRTLVNAVLKNDNAFLFTKNNGLLTLRQWGRTYIQHEIATWQYMKFPKRSYQDAQRYYSSSVLLEYEQDISSNTYLNQFLFNLDALLDKVNRTTYQVELYEEEDLDNLANRLIARFSDLAEIISMYSGKSTEDINLLDTVLIDLNINGRQFSTKTTWIVREVDPGQDILVLESTLSASELGIIAGVLSQPLSDGLSGILSQPFDDGISGNLSQPLSVTI